MPRVLLTRPRLRSHGADVMHDVLLRAGISVQELPMLNFESPREMDAVDESLARAARGEFSAIILSSPTAVHFFDERASELGLSPSLKQTGRFGVVGQATAEALAQRGYATHFPIPSAGGSNHLAAIFAKQELAGQSVLLLQSQLGLEFLEHALESLGALPTRVTLYYTLGPSLADSARLLYLLESADRPDVIAFFSPSSVTFFVRALAEMASGMLHSLPALACIGETTAKAVEEALHRRPEIVARKADQRSLAEDILIYLGLRQIRN